LTHAGAARSTGGARRRFYRARHPTYRARRQTYRVLRRFYRARHPTYRVLRRFYRARRHTYRALRRFYRARRQTYRVLRRFYRARRPTGGALRRVFGAFLGRATTSGTTFIIAAPLPVCCGGPAVSLGRSGCGAKSSRFEEPSFFGFPRGPDVSPPVGSTTAPSHAG
jgi:hypothetical protein